MKRTPMLLAVLLAAALAWPASAAEAARRPRCNDLRALARALALTPEQLTATKEIYKQLRDTVEPLRDDIEPLREQLEALLDEPNPAAGQVGQVVIDIDALRDDIHDARQAAEEDFEALLTPSQLEKYHAWEQRCRPAGD